MRWTRILALLPALAAGCTFFRAPTVEVAGVAVGEIGADAVQLVFDLRVANPNALSLELDELGYRLAVEGREVYAGRRAAGANLAPLGAQRLSVPAVVPREAADGAASLALRGFLRYRTPGQIAQRLFDTGVRRPRTKFLYEGPLTPIQPTQPAQAPPAAQPERPLRSTG